MCVCVCVRLCQKFDKNADYKLGNVRLTFLLLLLDETSQISVQVSANSTLSDDMTLSRGNSSRLSYSILEEKEGRTTGKVVKC